MNIRMPDLQVYLDLRVKEKLNHWINLAKGEVSGLGLLEEEIDKKGEIVAFHIINTFLLKQNCTSANTELNPEAISELILEIERKGIDSSFLKVWWHSHGQMDCFWSEIDERCIEGLANDTFFVSLVLNKKGQMRTRVDFFKPLRITIDDVFTSVLLPDLGLFKECEKEFQEKVIEDFPIFPHLPSHYLLDSPFFEDIDEKLFQLNMLLQSGQISEEEYERELRKNF